jgi:hypothetical protein
MGVLSEDTFDNEGARVYLKMWTAKLVATITDVINDDERLDADEDGETLLMPSVELLALLCERYGEPPPKPEAVHCWRDRYLERFDATVDRLGRGEEFKAARRKVVEKTFRWLEGLAESHWA